MVRLSSITALLLFSPFLGGSSTTYAMFVSCCHNGVTEVFRLLFRNRIKAWLCVESSPPTRVMSRNVPRGSAHLSARALLEHPRKMFADSDAVAFDVLIHSAESVNGSNIICCALQYTSRSDADSFEAGLYDIYAKVCYVVYDIDTLC